MGIPGWLFMILIIIPFYGILAQYFFREICMVWLLYYFTRRWNVQVRPQHPDAIGGLKPISQLGLHYQWMIVVMGIHVGSLFVTLNLVYGDPFSGFLGWLALVAYAILAPIAFVAPLLPFRKFMIYAKQKSLERLSSAYLLLCEQTLARIESHEEKSSQYEDLEYLQNLVNTARRFPEWPLDISTFRKFVVTFIIPIITTAVSTLVSAVLLRL